MDCAVEPTAGQTANAFVARTGVHSDRKLTRTNLPSQRKSIGNLAIGAVVQRDLPLLQGLVLTFAVLFIATNLCVDLICTLLNPKVRHA